MEQGNREVKSFTQVHTVIGRDRIQIQTLTTLLHCIENPQRIQTNLTLISCKEGNGMVKEKRAFTFYSVYVYIENSMYHLNDLQRNIFLKKASHKKLRDRWNSVTRT